MKELSIGKYRLKHPIIQGGMGIGISWDQLAGSVSREGGLGVVSSVGTGYYNDTQFSKKNISHRPHRVDNFYCKEALQEIINNARKLCGNKPLACNILYASNDYGRIVQDACEVGFNIIISGAGLPLSLPQYTKDYPDVSLIPIVSSARALKLICKKWQRYNKVPDAIIVEGPLSGGHQGFSYEACLLEESKLENIIPSIIKESKKWGDIPIIAAGGIWDSTDINSFLKLGCQGVQMGTRFIGTIECDASPVFKQQLLDAKEEDIVLMKSPVGLPARAIKTKLHTNIQNSCAPKVACISNCVSPCESGVEAKKVGYCIADRLTDAAQGKEENGLFFTGANGYKMDEIVSVKSLINELTVSA